MVRFSQFTLDILLRSEYQDTVNHVLGVFVPQKLRHYGVNECSGKQGLGILDSSALPRNCLFEGQRMNQICIGELNKPSQD